LGENALRVFCGDLRLMRRKWAAVTSTASVCFVVAGSSAGVVGPIFGPLMKELAWSNGKTSALATAYTLGYLLTTPAVGFAVDKVGPRVVMALGTWWRRSGY